MADRIDIEDGKYTVVIDGGHVQILRHGEPWVGEEPGGFVASKAWIAAAYELQELRRRVENLQGENESPVASKARKNEELAESVIPSSEESRYLPRAEAADYFNVSTGAVRGWCDRELITAYRRLGKVYVDVEEIEEALRRLPRSVMRDGRGRFIKLPTLPGGLDD